MTDAAIFIAFFAISTWAGYATVRMIWWRGQCAELLEILEQRLGISNP